MTPPAQFAQHNAIRIPFRTTTTSFEEHYNEMRIAERRELPPRYDASQLLIHAKIYMAADRYDVPGLKDLSNDKFKTACDIFWADR
ncbi:hypothetical protein A1F94_001606 [Pyrenophora tritici-repentis]|uniref:Uncharacterized protein n=3 Tax=Pyrenophora tritici-repentis TaxID=45151 RepID=A0A922NND5_9PLEO|nr:uncharacterized protein PTRG_01820 [Pyrenophora tritici-repentis Pt-1C-BFP]EDU41258.1 predicted protein [Pyrenophora tritici-repentis Pt-1C-BFP]KAG9388713.1 hypothetical protein A1F94_001606 [Pyrenophora tritici-repentis]KAI1518182.1 hypothetical protein Ptr86124_003483 [Pyrenophora tritici-repentis]KAI1688999.1 hypothetical protein KJE20_02177 [Pyrenophora tritici-repentis]